MPSRRSELPQVDVFVTAAVRAAVAWSQRKEDPGRAWREISSMTGVMSYVRGPADGAKDPVGLIDALRHPLSKLAPELPWEHEPLADISLIDADDALAPDVHEWAGEYLHALYLAADDSGTKWLPTWSWQRAEQVERLFNDDLRSGSEEEYSRTREFVIKSPAGVERELVTRRNKLGALPAGSFAAIPSDRKYGRYWWACPRCAWPMRVSGTRVRCEIRSHGADYQLSASSEPDAVPTVSARTSTRKVAPRARNAADSVCVPEAIWRFIVVPGLAELELRDKLERVPWTSVSMWPGRDVCDLRVRVDGCTQMWEVDVKDHARVSTIAERPPSAQTLVVPNSRSQQLRTLRERLPTKDVYSISAFVKHVGALAKGIVRDIE